MTEPEKKMMCPKCGKEIAAGLDECPLCKFTLADYFTFADYMDVYEKSKKASDPPKKKKRGLFSNLAPKE